MAWQIADEVLVSSTMTEDPKKDVELNLGPQPLDTLMTERQFSSHDLVAACKEQMTHKAVVRARKGRRLTPKMKVRMTETFNALLRSKGEEATYGVKQLFNY
ncbi:hypothetical protein BH11VER1_BH11VER1_12460 [soil metagenome]